MVPRHKKKRSEANPPFFGCSPWGMLVFFFLASCWLVFPLSAIPLGDFLKTTYRLEPGDVVKIMVENEPNLNLETKISDQGEINVALIGTVHVAQMTAIALEKTLQEKWLDGYLKNPIVAVTVDKYKSYHVHGEVRKTGKYPFQADMTVRKAIAMAGGFSPFASHNQVTLVHTKDRPHTVEGSIARGMLSKSVGMDAPIFPGDIINVPMAAPQQKEGDFMEAVYRLGPGDKIKVVVDNEPSLNLEANISAQGGVNFPFAGEIYIANLTVKEAEEAIRHKLLQGFLLNPVVFITVLEYRVYYMHGEVKKADGYPFQPGLTIRKAIALAGGFTEFADKKDILVIHDDDPLFREHSIGLDEPVLPGDIINITASFW